MKAYLIHLDMIWMHASYSRINKSCILSSGLIVWCAADRAAGRQPLSKTLNILTNKLELLRTEINETSHLQPLKKQRLFSKNADIWLFDLLHLGLALCQDSGCCGTPQGRPVIKLGYPAKHQFLNAGTMVLWWTVERCSSITGYTSSQWSDKCWRVPEIISQSLRTDIKRDVCEEGAALNTSASHKITSLIHSRCWCAVNRADYMITLL